MAYTPATDYPNLDYSQWSRPEAPNPALASGIGATTADNTLLFTEPLLDHVGVVTIDVLIGVKRADGYVETMLIPAGGLSVDGLTAIGVIRAIRLEGLDYTTSDTTLISQFDAGDIVFCNISGVIQGLNAAALQAQIGANIKFNGRPLWRGNGIQSCPVFATAAVRDATILSPQNGDMCYVTASGMFFDYTAGSWIARASGGVFPNASTTVAGKVELATQAENNAGTSTGGTGAALVATPDVNALTIQNGSWVYGVDTGVVNAYVVVLTPVLPSYQTGQKFRVNITNANTGPSTINFGPGIKNIKKGGTTDVAAGDIVPGITEFTYDGTNFQLDALELPTYGAASSNSMTTTGVLGEAFSASDVTNNLNLAYQDPTTQKWFKVTSTASTWYNRLGIVLIAGILNATSQILLKGTYSGKTFSNINPTFSSALTGTDNNVGDVAGNTIRAFKVDNTAGAEAILSGAMTISAKQVGAPSGQMNIYLVLEQNDQSAPAAVWDATNRVVRGAIIATGSIPQANFSGAYQSLACTLTPAFTTIKVPAGVNMYVVISKAGVVNAANYYVVQSNAATLAYNATTQTWSGTPNAGNLALTVTSTSPIGYAIKAYNGSNGSFGLTPSSAWAKCIGNVLTTTSMFFDPAQNISSLSYQNNGLNYTVMTPINNISVNFCPSSVRVAMATINNGTTNYIFNLKGSIRGDSNNANSFVPNGVGSSTGIDNYLGVTNGAAAIFGNGVGSSTQLRLGVNLNTGTGVLQNYLQIVRLESGFFVYPGYPAGSTGYIDGGNSVGFVQVGYTMELESKV